jgi:phosphatidylinositol glycan class N
LTLVVASLTIPFLHLLDPVSYYLHRLLVIFLAFAPSFVLLTISYEGIFYFVFCITLLTWMRLEDLIHKHHIPHPTSPKDSQLVSKTNGSTTFKSKKSRGNHARPEPAQSQSTPQQNGSLIKETATYRPLTLSDTRPSLFTLYLLQSAFFSTGNIASVSSFSLDAVYRLIPVFDPFSQGALLIFKILIPFIMLSATLGILNKKLGVAPGALFMGLMVFGDWLTVNFFWMVRDEGSWLEIGETISRFCIVSALCVFVAALEGGSGWLVGDVVSAEDACADALTSGKSELGNGTAKNGGVVTGSNGVKDAVNGAGKGKKKPGR